MATKPKRFATHTVIADDLLVTDDDGEEFAPREGEWVKLRKKFPMRLLRVGAQLSRLYTEGEDDVDMEEVEEAFDRLIGLLAPLVVDWSWTNHKEDEGEDGKPPILPVPRHEPDVLWDLDEDELMWILDKISDQVAAPNP